MPEGHKAERARAKKQNIANGIGDANGILPGRAEKLTIMIKCTVCMNELKATKTNAELNAHLNKHAGMTLEECFPGAGVASTQLSAAAPGKGGAMASAAPSGPTKAEKKKKASAGLDDLLSAGLDTGKKGKGKK